MTEGEKMIWAATFGAVMAKSTSATAARVAADYAVECARELRQVMGDDVFVSRVISR